jgi:hypothetical protein
MRRYGAALLILIVLLVCLLYSTDFLTGRTHREQEDPYSRERRIVGSRYGLPFNQVIPTEMTAYYFDVLKQKRINHWVTGSNNYAVERFTGKVRQEPQAVPPVLFLDPKIERAFLESLPNNAARLAVIRSLYKPRQPETSSQAREANRKQAALETERVNRILTWHLLRTTGEALAPGQWWRDNARYFGLRPDGRPL